jgi:tRNA (guanine37-N1)-methyltransferase
VLGNPESTEWESFRRGLLEGPHYTRPASFRGLAVPEVLRSGDHGAVERWRRERALEWTRKRRPDLAPDGNDADEPSHSADPREVGGGQSAGPRDGGTKKGARR